MSAFMCSPELIRTVACVLDGHDSQPARSILFGKLWQLNRDAIRTRYGEEDYAEIGDAPEWVETWDGLPVDRLHPLSTAKDRAKIVRLLRSCECFAYQCSEGAELERRLVTLGVDGAIRNLQSQLLNTIPEYAAAGWPD